MTRLYVRMLCEQCGKPHGQLWGASPNDPDVESGLCFECQCDNRKREDQKLVTVFVIRPTGEIEELASYCLAPKEALKNAWLQFVEGRTDTWNWSGIEAPIVEGKHVYSIDTPIGVLSVRKDNCI